MPRILIIENYPPDGQRSMIQYASLLSGLLRETGWDVHTWHPPVRFGRGRVTTAGAAKYAGYLDKYLLAPRALRRHLRELHASGTPPGIVNISDHSNAIYARSIRHLPVVITLHDLIAVRRALGDLPVSPPALTGRLQQQWILKALKRQRHFVFISQASRQDYARLTGNRAVLKHAPVIYSCLGQPMQRLPSDETRRRLQAANIDAPSHAIHHHGGDAWYKNRDAVIDIFIRLANTSPQPALILSGAPLSPDQNQRLAAAGLSHAVRDLGPVGRETLEALYNHASVFLFPSIIEGFGWPPLEAQACGCPVVASNGGSLREVLADSAKVFEPGDLAGMSTAIRHILQTPAEATRLREAGLRNITRFNPQAMQSAYHQYLSHLCAASQQS